MGGEVEILLRFETVISAALCRTRSSRRKAVRCGVNGAPPMDPLLLGELLLLENRFGLCARRIPLRHGSMPSISRSKGLSFSNAQRQNIWRTSMQFCMSVLRFQTAKTKPTSNTMKLSNINNFDTKTLPTLAPLTMWNDQAASPLALWTDAKVLRRHVHMLVTTICCDRALFVVLLQLLQFGCICKACKDLKHLVRGAFVSMPMKLHSKCSSVLSPASAAALSCGAYSGCVSRWCPTRFNGSCTEFPKWHNTESFPATFDVEKNQSLSPMSSMIG